MSARPTLFLAHSSDDKLLARDLAHAIQQQAGPGFDVFFDAESIPLGAFWSEAIEDHLLDCVAALLLLTPKASDAPYMPHEAYLLSLRRRFDPQLQIFPVFAGGMTEADLPGSPFQHARLDAPQARFLPPSLDVAPTAADIARQLKADADWLPWSSVERYAADSLRALGDDGIEQAIETLVPNPRIFGDVKLVRQKRRWLARQLFRMSTEELGEFAYRMAPFFRQDPGALVELLRTVLPFVWVQSDDARLLEQTARAKPPRRALCLAFRTLATPSPAAAPTPKVPFPDVPDLYARHASSKIPSWKVKSGDFVTSHQASADIAECLLTLARDVVMDVFGEYTPDQLREELRRLVTERQETILVVLPKSFNASDAELLETMTGFSEAFTFLLTSEESQPDLARRFPNLVLLPELPLPRQRELHRACRRALENLPL